MFLDDLLEMIVDWIEYKGFEVFVDYDSERIMYYNADEELKFFCHLNHSSLSRAIERYDI